MLFDLNKTQKLIDAIVKSNDAKAKALELLPAGEFPKLYDSVNEHIDSIQIEPDAWGKLTSIFPTKIFERNGGPLAAKRPVLSEAQEDQFVTIYCNPDFQMSVEQVNELETMLGRDVGEGSVANSNFYNIYTSDPAIIEKAKVFIGEENIQEVAPPEPQAMASVREDRVRAEIKAALEKKKVLARAQDLEVNQEPNSITIRATNPEGFISTVDTTADDLLTDENRSEELDRALNSVEDSLHDWMANNGMNWISPEEAGALTEAPMFGEHEREDDGSVSEIHSLFYYPDYMITDWRKRVLEGDTVRFLKHIEGEDLNEEVKPETEASVVRASEFIFEDQPTQILALEEFFKWMYEGRVENDAQGFDYDPANIGQDVEDQLTGVAGTVNGKSTQDIFKTLVTGLSEAQIKEAAASVDAIDYISEGWAYYDGNQYKEDVQKMMEQKAEGYVTSAGFFDDSEKMALQNDYNGKIAALKQKLPNLYKAMLSGESADSYWGGINDVEELQTPDGKKVYFIETPGHGFYHDEKGAYIGEEDEGFQGDWAQYNQSRQAMHDAAIVIATGEPDGDYAKEDFDKMCEALRAAGFEAEHKEFDKYQGIFITAKKNNKRLKYWVADFFTAGEVKKDPKKKWRSAILIDSDGDQFSATKGDYFQMGDADVFDDTTLVLVDMQGKETRIENPTKGDLPDLLEVQNNIQYEGEPSSVYGLQREGAPDDAIVYVTIPPEGEIDADELVADAEAGINEKDDFSDMDLGDQEPVKTSLERFPTLAWALGKPDAQKKTKKSPGLKKALKEFSKPEMDEAKLRIAAHRGLGVDGWEVHLTIPVSVDFLKAKDMDHQMDEFLSFNSSDPIEVLVSMIQAWLPGRVGVRLGRPSFSSGDLKSQRAKNGIKQVQMSFDVRDPMMAYALGMDLTSWGGSFEVPPKEEVAKRLATAQAKAQEGKAIRDNPDKSDADWKAFMETLKPLGMNWQIAKALQ